MTVDSEDAQTPDPEPTIPAAQPNAIKSTVPASEISKTMDIDKEEREPTTDVINVNQHDDATVPATTEVINVNQHDDDTVPATTEVINVNQQHDGATVPVRNGEKTKTPDPVDITIPCPVTTVIPSAQPNAIKSTIPASEISTTMDIDEEGREPKTTEVINDSQQHDDATVPVRKGDKTETPGPVAVAIPCPVTTLASVTTIEKDSPGDNTCSTDTDKIEKKNLPGDKLIEPVTNRPTPRINSAYVKESKSYLSEISNLELWKDLVDIWVEFENDCPQRGVSIRFFVDHMTAHLECGNNSPF